MILMAKVRWYSRDSANELLPEVRERLAGLQQAYPAVRQMRAASAGNGGGSHTEEWKRSLAVFEEQLEWFNEAGILVKDIAQGLVDFPSDRNGEQILLCWKADEASVDFWHYPDGGFAGRQPLNQG